MTPLSAIAPLARGEKRRAEEREKSPPAKRARIDREVALVENFLAQANFDSKRPFSPLMSQWNVKKEKIIGSGSWGMVAPANDGAVAKFPHPERIADTLPALVKESQNLLQLIKEKTPHIPLIRDVIYRHPDFFLIIDNVGPSLDKLFKEELCDPYNGIIIEKQLLEVTSHLADRHLIHGDIKRANGCYDKATKKFTLIDWGTLTKSTCEDLHFLTTSNYQAPEIVLEQLCTPKVDTWAAALLIYSIMTGESFVKIHDETPRLEILHQQQARTTLFSKQMILKCKKEVIKRFFQYKVGEWKLKNSDIDLSSISPSSTLLEQTKQNYLEIVPVDSKAIYTAYWDVLNSSLLSILVLDPELRPSSREALSFLTNSLTQANLSL